MANKVMFSTLSLIILLLTLSQTFDSAESVRCYSCFGTERALAVCDIQDCGDYQTCASVTAGDDVRKIWKSCVRADMSCRDPELQNKLRGEYSRQCSICTTDLCNSASSITSKLSIVVFVVFYLFAYVKSM